MPLDLDRLKRGESDEWERAWRELHVWDVASSVVRQYLEPRYAQHVEDVAANAVRELWKKGIRNCRSVDDIVPLLRRRIALQESAKFLRKAWTRRELLRDEGEDAEEKGPVEINDAEDVKRMIDELVERLHLGGFDLERLLAVLVTGAELDYLEQALLREHVVGGCTQQDFADRNALPVNGIGGRKHRILRKLRRFLGL